MDEQLPEGGTLRLGLLGRFLDVETEPGRVYTFMEREDGKWTEAGGWGRKSLKLAEVGPYVELQDLL